MSITVEFLPAIVNLDFYRGDEVVIPFTIEDQNLGGSTSLAQIRVAKDRSSTLVGTFTVGLTNAGSDTTVELTLPSTENQDYIGSFWWDLQITTAGAPRTWMAGRCDISNDVSNS